MTDATPERPRYYDRDGLPIDIEQFSQLHGDLDYVVVARFVCEDGAWLSTVWLGIDHSFALDLETPPIIFETLGFLANRSDEVVGCRYSTFEQAIAGHYEQLAELLALRAATNQRSSNRSPTSRARRAPRRSGSPRRRSCTSRKGARRPR